MGCSTFAADFRGPTGLWSHLMAQRDKGSVFLTPQWQETWWHHHAEESKELLLLSIGDAGSNFSGVAPLVRDGDKLGFLGGTDLFDYHDFILGEAPPLDFYSVLARCLNQERWTELRLESIHEDSATLEYLPAQLIADGHSVTIEHEDVVPGITLPSSWDQFLEGLRKKDRHELRRKLRRLEEAGEYRLVHAEPQRLETELDLFLSLMKESRDEKRDFMDPRREAFLREAAFRMQEEGFLRLSFLEFEGQRVAAAMCFDYAGSRFLYNSGYRTSLKQHSVGLVLKALCIQEAIELGLLYFDFLRGAEQYKYHLGATDRNLYRIVAQRR